MLFRLLSLASLCFCSVSMAQDFYVSPSGNDILNGLSPKTNYWQRTGPFKTLVRAQQAIRDLKAAGKFNEAITVHVGKGTYQLKTPLEFDDNDSGFPGQEILWQGEKGATIISGGILLKSCHQYDAANPEQILSCPIDANTVANIKGETNDRILGNAPAFEVFVNERRMHLARWPDSDWAHINTPINERTHFSVFEKIPQFSGNLSDAQIHTFPGNDTSDQYLGVSTIDLANNRIILSNNTGSKLAKGRRFYLQNIEAALDAPEEWFYDKTNNKILFIPPADIEPSSIILSSATNLIKVRDASHIGFSNLTFRHSTSNAINIDGSDTVLLDNLEINNVRGIAIRAPNNSNIAISNNDIHHVGLGGILLSGGDRPTLHASGNLIDNNHIHNYDTILFNNSPAIFIGGVATTVLHNLIENGHGNALVLNGNNHIVEKNEISQICQQTSDCGGIYSGRDWTYRGNIIRYNYVHDFSGFQFYDITNNVVRYARDGARGIYLDDGVSGFTVFGNIVVNTGMIGIHIGGGRDNLVENNIIETNKYSILVDNRNPSFDKNSLKTMPVTSSTWLANYPTLGIPMNHDTWPEGNTIQRNITIKTVDHGGTIRYAMPMHTNTISNNLVWNANNLLTVDYMILDKNLTKSGALWDNWISQGIEKGSLFANPCINISGGKIGITCSDSPAYQIGFKAIPTDIGLAN